MTFYKLNINIENEEGELEPLFDEEAYREKCIDELGFVHE